MPLPENIIILFYWTALQPLFFIVLRGLETQRFRASHMTAAPFFEADESFSASASYSL